MARSSSVILSKEEKKTQIAELKVLIKDVTVAKKGKVAEVKAADKAREAIVKAANKDLKALEKTLTGLVNRLSALSEPKPTPAA